MSASADSALPSVPQDGTMGLKSVPPSPPGRTRQATSSAAAAPSTAKQIAATDTAAHDSQNDPDSQQEDSASALSRSPSMSLGDSTNVSGLPTAFALLSMAPVDITTAEGVVGICRAPSSESTHSRIKRAAQETFTTATVLTAVVQHSSAVRTDLEKLKLATNMHLAEARRSRELLSKIAPSSASMGPPPTDTSSAALNACQNAVDQVNLKMAGLQSELSDVRGAMVALSAAPPPSILADFEALRISSTAQHADTLRIIDTTARNAAPRDETTSAIAHVDAKVMALDNALVLLKGEHERSVKEAAAKPFNDHGQAIADLDARLTVFNVDCSTVVAKARDDVANTSTVVDSLAVSIGELSAKLSGYELLSSQQQSTIDAFRTTIARLESQVASALAPAQQPMGMALQAMQARQAQAPPVNLGLASVMRTPSLATIQQNVAPLQAAAQDAISIHSPQTAPPVASKNILAQYLSDASARAPAPPTPMPSARSFVFDNAQATTSLGPFTVFQDGPAAKRPRFYEDNVSVVMAPFSPHSPAITTLKGLLGDTTMFSFQTDTCGPTKWMDGPNGTVLFTRFRLRSRGEAFVAWVNTEGQKLAKFAGVTAATTE